MQTQWQQFLLEQDAQLDERGQLGFSNLAESITSLDTTGSICSLDHLGCIRASGADVQVFLQGQLSNDINELQNARIQLSAYCNPKGRMLAQFIVIPDKADYLLLLPRSILEPTLKRLRMFVLRSQVTLTDASDEIVCLGLAGSGVTSQLGDALSMPAEDYQLSQTDTMLVCKLPAPWPRFLIVTTLSPATTLWQQATAHLLATDQHLWHWLDIQAGLPSIWPQTVEEFVPQMVNLELINGVNFKKGCYPGQEIVARMHYLGKAKRRMYRLSLEQGQCPEPGTDLFVASGDAQSAGKIVLAEPGPQDCQCLAVIKTDKVEAELHLGQQDGPKLTLATLPYPLDSG